MIGIRQGSYPYKRFPIKVLAAGPTTTDQAGPPWGALAGKEVKLQQPRATEVASSD
jgi:hypothetical protein